MTVRAAMASALLAFLAGGEVASAAADCSPARLDLRGEGLHQSFVVELADDAAERAQGLMQRDRLDADRGMFFVYETSRRATFWMKDTLIPLDMIFADDRGVVTRVHANAVPLDETPIDGGAGVRFVLEINGGLAARLGIVPGMELRHPAIPAATAAWPCD